MVKDHWSYIQTCALVSFRSRLTDLLPLALQMKKLTKTCVDLEHAATEKLRAETELKKQVEDLKRRLAMGAEEYKRKWIECKKLQKKMDKIKKDHCKLLSRK